MCGRYTIAHSSDDILERFEAIIAEAAGSIAAGSAAVGSNSESTANANANSNTIAGGNANSNSASTSFRANFNVAPSTQVPLISRPNVDSAVDAPRVLESARWGLLPFWVKDLKKAKPLINARAETLLESKTFKHPFMRRRCIIPAESFYEWQKTTTKKTPVRFLLKGHRLFGFAGIWDEWHSPEGEVIKSCSIITVAANELVQPVHDRMPAILPPHMEALWLDTSRFDATELCNALAPYPAEEMEMYAVSDLVNSVKNNSPLCVEPAGNDNETNNGESECPTQMTIQFS
jgi:putative SOS response-associated peptidase YedK